MQPKFIAIEGLDGSGGTTQVARLAQWLRDAGHAVHTTREPSTGPVGRFIRRALDPQQAEAALGEAVLPYLFAADRRDHLDREILPALAGGAWVITDRYALSSLAYQSLAIGLPAVARLNADFRPPDLTILLDLSAQACMARIEARGGTRERFEQTETLSAIAEAYDRAAAHVQAAGHALVRIDASDSIAAVHQQVLAAIQPTPRR